MVLEHHTAAYLPLLNAINADLKFTKFCIWHIHLNASHCLHLNAIHSMIHHISLLPFLQTPLPAL